MTAKISIPAILLLFLGLAAQGQVADRGRNPVVRGKTADGHETRAGGNLFKNTGYVAFQARQKDQKPPERVNGARLKGWEAARRIALFEVPADQDADGWKISGIAEARAAGLDAVPCFSEPGSKWVIPTEQVLVKFRADVTHDQAEKFLTASGATGVNFHRIIENMAIADVASPLESFEKADQWAGSDLVQWTEVNCYREVRSKWIPDDEYFANQWYLRNTGQGGGFRNHDIEIEKAWEITRGTSSVVVAILDNGFDLNHLDLKDNVYNNILEGTPGEDRDGNGYTNDVNGWDFVDNDNDPSPDACDRHGTAVAGIISAAASNNYCIAGVAPECRFLPLRVYTDGLGADQIKWTDAITYAASNAAVISISAYIYPSQSAQEALRYAASRGRGGLGCVVCAALGNTGVRRRYSGDLASSAEAITVSALSNYDKRSYFGDYGPALNVMCPGGGGSLNMYTTDWSGTNGYNNSYWHSWYGGTSASCPMVAGVAALILSLHPDWPGIKVREVIEDTCDRVDAIANDYGSLGRNEQYGRGRVNARSALEYAGGTWDKYEPDGGTNSASRICDGEMQYRAIDPADDQDWAYLTLSNESDICLSIVGTTNADIVLYNSASNQVNPASSAYPPYASAVYTNRPAGTYFVKVSGVGAAVVSNYGLHLAVLATKDDYESDNTLETAKTISPRQMQYRSVYPTGDVDWVKFTLPGATTVDIRTFGEWAGDTKIWLRDSVGVELAFDDDGAISNYYSRIQTNLNAGTYYVEVREFTNRVLSTYQFLVDTYAADEWEPSDNTTNGATNLVSGTISAHTLHVTNDVDWFAFAVTSPATALLVTDSLNPELNFSLGDTKISLYDSGLNLLFEDNDGNRSFFSAIVATNLVAGTYYLKVEGFFLTNACPDYTVSLDIYEKKTTIDSFSRVSNGVSLQWQGEASFNYHAQYSSNLLNSGAWITATTLEGRIGSNSWTDDGSSTVPGPDVTTNRFYRINVE